MNFKAKINIMPRAELLDPQGKTVAKNMDHVDITGIQDVRIGKRIEIILTADNLESAHNNVDNACKTLLANLIMETYEYDLETF